MIRDQALALGRFKRVPDRWQTEFGRWVRSVESALGKLNHLRVQLFAVLGSATSWQTFEWEVDRV